MYMLVYTILVRLCLLMMFKVLSYLHYCTFCHVLGEVFISESGQKAKITDTTNVRLLTLYIINK